MVRLQRLVTLLAIILHAELAVAALQLWRQRAQLPIDDDESRPRLQCFRRSPPPPDSTQTHALWRRAAAARHVIAHAADSSCQRLVSVSGGSDSLVAALATAVDTSMRGCVAMRRVLARAVDASRQQLVVVAREGDTFTAALAIAIDSALRGCEVSLRPTRAAASSALSSCKALQRAVHALGDGDEHPQRAWLGLVPAVLLPHVRASLWRRCWPPTWRVLPRSGAPRPRSSDSTSNGRSSSSRRESRGQQPRGRRSKRRMQSRPSPCQPNRSHCHARRSSRERSSSRRKRVQVCNSLPHVKN